MIAIEENEAEYLLFIPAFQKERAKAIPGRRWDPERKAWVFPRTTRVYDALITEFGDDLTAVAITRPEVPDSKASPKVLATENQELKEEITKIRKTIELLASSANRPQNDTVQDLKTTIASYQQQLTDLNALLEGRNREVAAIKNQLQERGRELEEARAAQPSANQSDLKENVAALAMMTTGNDVTFRLTLDRLPLDSSLPIEFAKIIDRALRTILKAMIRIYRSTNLSCKPETLSYYLMRPSIWRTQFASREISLLIKM